MDSHEILYRHSWSPEDFGDPPTSTTSTRFTTGWIGAKSYTDKVIVKYCVVLRGTQINSVLTHQSGMNVKGQVWCTSLHYAVILIKCNSLCSLTHSMIECVRSARDWWMLFSRCNGPQGALLNNDQHIWLMSAVSSSWGESFRLSLLLCAARDERSPFAGRDDDWYYEVLTFSLESPHFMITHLWY